MSNSDAPITKEDALALHQDGRPGKLEIAATKPLTTQRDLSLAYSPGVAWPCLEIAETPAKAYDYTAKSNLVAVVSNGTAVLGLGNLGALASKPVMEGKAVLFKRFADIDGVDIELDTEDPDEIIEACRLMAPTFGGINLEDIRAPDCFVIEQKLKEMLDIPVFHDDQHGTAIIGAAGLLNSLEITGRKISDVKLVINGAGAAGIACADLFKELGVPPDQVILCDSRGVIYRGREDGMNQWKSAHAVETDARSLADAMEGADVFVGLSVKDAVDQDMVKRMGEAPIIFALANPEPEILPDAVKAVSPRAIVATGRSDFPNQVNNVLGFPYLFRGALDVRAREINPQMKLAAAQALAELAKEDVPDEVGAAYSGRRPRFGPNYIIPAPFDPRLIEKVPMAVAKAAVETGAARMPIKDMEGYGHTLRSRLDTTANMMQRIAVRLRQTQQRVVFAEGEDPRTIRAALAFRQAGYGQPILIGRQNQIQETMADLGLAPSTPLEIVNAANWDYNADYTDYLYKKQQRNGLLHRDCQRLINLDRNVFGASMLAHGDADALVTGLTRNFWTCFKDLRLVLDRREDHVAFGMATVVFKNRTIFIADTAVHELPDSDVLVKIVTQAAAAVRRLGHEPRVALLSFSNFGAPQLSRVEPLKQAVESLREMNLDFEVEGEMGADIALDYDLMRRLYPFSRLTGPANVLVMPGMHVANICYKMLRMLGGCTTIGPFLDGLEKPAFIAPLGATVNDVVNLAALAAYESTTRR